MTSDKRWQAKFSALASCWKQFLSLKNSRSVRICSVLNRSNRDTTVYYRLIFCAFSWPNMVKWRNSGIIINNYWTRLSKISWFFSGEQINYLFISSPPRGINTAYVSPPRGICPFLKKKANVRGLARGGGGGGWGGEWALLELTDA